MITLTSTAYQDKVLGAWLGKRIGCAAGAPVAGEKQPREITDYPAALSPIPLEACEGLPFARLWLEELRVTGPGLSGEDLVRIWLERLRCTQVEYGYAQANFRLDLLPPVSGVYNNPYRESLGALARAEVWGMLAPADPATAARYALQDASLDHAGAGVEAAMLLAGLVSAAFAESDPARLVEVALRLAPREARVTRVVRDVARWHGELAHWRRTREMLLRSYGAEDLRDATVAIGLITLALLDGKGDFGATLTSAARCGWSTACTCAAVGAVLGAAHGAAGLPEQWRALGEGNELTALAAGTFELGQVVVASESEGRVRVSDDPPEAASGQVVAEAGGLLHALAMGPYVVSFRRGPLEVLVDYETHPTLGYDTPRRLSFGIINHAARSLELRLRLAAPEGFIAVTDAAPFTLAEKGSVSFSASITAPQEHCRLASVIACLLFLSIEDAPELSVPVTLIGESVWYVSGPYDDFEQSHPPETLEARGQNESTQTAPAWRRLSAAEPAVNLLAGLEGERGTYYLAKDFFSTPDESDSDQLEADAPQPVRLRLACNDGLVAWLNGRQILSHHQHRPADPRVCADEYDLELQPGANRLLLKLAQCSPRRLLAVTLTDREGNQLRL